jgi:hypothetical protein
MLSQANAMAFCSISCLSAGSQDRCCIGPRSQRPIINGTQPRLLREPAFSADSEADSLSEGLCSPPEPMVLVISGYTWLRSY